MTRNDATAAQIRAARPDKSTWVSANAGSGKTRVLTDRVARLLLDGVAPQRILCLTYTKAAATEMQNRLFRRLGAWAMLDDATLTRQLFDLGLDHALDAAALNAARTLFARAIETPGGLKIQTIHSFCAALLRRFPLESQVSPQFREMDDRAAALLRADILRDMAAEPCDSPHRAAMERVAVRLSGADFDKLAKTIVEKRAGFPPGQTLAMLAPRFGLTPDARRDDALALAFDGSEARFARDLTATLTPVNAFGRDYARAWNTWDWDAPGWPEYDFLMTAFYTGGELRSGRFPDGRQKNAVKAMAAMAADIDAFMARVDAARAHLAAMTAWHATADLHAFADPFLRAYQDHKLRRGWLDFDDLIIKARDLLAGSDVAAWVLYRLDGGIDHILVDEAQDTNPLQWQVIERLSEEMTSGVGARDNRVRTIFVVGDKKQSIYSFQGADPREFDRMRARIDTRLAPSNPLETTTLQHSFRSAATILDLVDRTFQDSAASGFDDALHRAFHTDLPGRVDLWPLVAPAAKDDPPDDATLDWVSPDHHDTRLAQQIAADIARMIATETIPASPDPTRQLTRRPVRAGDILILVQRRSALFGAIIRACKAAGLPIAGADRLKVGAELAVRDLAALLSFLATPEDDLALATTLRSPLLGWSEQALFTLAHGRGPKSLWQALREQQTDHPLTWTMLRDLRDQTDFLRPYDLIERVLIRHDGRRRLLARLGPEAQDGIDAFLSQALAYEDNDVPSLTGFMGWMETDDLDIKRQMDGGADEIRVMTVHGAKGLESPIVILPDTMDRRDPNEDSVVLHDGLCWWWLPKKEQPPQYADMRDATLAARRAERDRLLYVAMTRAEKWLILAGAGDVKDDSDGWFARLSQVMTDSGATPHDFGFGTGMRLESPGWHDLPLAAHAAKPQPPAVTLPAWTQAHAPAAPASAAPISPTGLGGAKALPGDGLDEASAKSYGALVHALLDQPVLSPDRAADHAMAIAAPFALPDALRAAALAEAAATRRNPDLAFLFDAQVLSEQPFSVTLPGLGRVYGIIDRLALRPGSVLAVDFKTNRALPATPADVPEGLLRQMGAYAAALGALYPGRRVDTALVWTRTGQIMPLPHDLVTAALQRAGSLDADRAAP